MGQAAEQLHQLRHLLLDAALPPEAAPARRRLLVRVAEALLDGSTPPAAVPLLAALLQEGLRRQGGGGSGGEDGDGGGAEGELGEGLSEADRASRGAHASAGPSPLCSTCACSAASATAGHAHMRHFIPSLAPAHSHHHGHTQARLVPLIVAGMAPPRQPGARQLLREGEGAGLLRALLRPEAALNAGQLGEAFDALQVGGLGWVGLLCTRVSSRQPAPDTP